MKFILILAAVVSTFASANPEKIEFAATIEADPNCVQAVAGSYFDAGENRLYTVETGLNGFNRYRLLNLSQNPVLAHESQVDFTHDTMESETVLNPTGIALLREDHNVLVVSMTRTRRRSPQLEYVTGFKSGLSGQVLSHIGEIPNFVGDNRGQLGIVAPTPGRTAIFLANRQPKLHLLYNLYPLRNRYSLKLLEVFYLSCSLVEMDFFQTLKVFFVNVLPARLLIPAKHLHSLQMPCFCRNNQSGGLLHLLQYEMQNKLPYVLRHFEFCK